MERFFELFNSKDADNFTFKTNGIQFKKSDCIQVAHDYQKDTYSVNGANLCFCVPADLIDIETEIFLENKRLQRIKSKLGFIVQNYEEAILTISESGKPDRQVKTLITLNLKRLCTFKSATIDVRTAYPYQGVVGAPLDVITLKERLKNKADAQQFLKKLINEYAIAATFLLPVKSPLHIDDSHNYYYELPENKEELPVIRYMFRDAPASAQMARFPVVPTMDDLKDYQKEIPVGLKVQAERIAISLWSMHPENKPGPESLDVRNAFITEVTADLLVALNDDALLKSALESAKTLAPECLAKEIKSVNKTEIHDALFYNMARSGISTGNLKLVKRILKLRPIFQNTMSELIHFSELYDNKLITDYLKSLPVRKNEAKPAELNLPPPNDFDREVAELNKLIDKINKPFVKPVLVEEKEVYKDESKEDDKQKAAKLKNQFFAKYTEKLKQDKGAWCGIYSIFAKSYVNKDMSLKELVAHAQGRSKQGMGKRSQQVMKEMGWLDENNQVTDEIKRFVK